MWIDSHCHLNHDQVGAADTPALIVARANAAGVEGMINICCRVADEFPLILETAAGLENVWCTVGTHPHDAGKEAEKAVTLEQLVTLARSHPKIVGIGESGLDYHYNYAPVDDQKTSFRKHIRTCIETGLPLVVHAREADDDIIHIIKEEGTGTSLTGVMHCFSSGRKMAEDALDLGFYISFSGIVTFKQAQDLQDIGRDVPLNRLLVETDAPFLAPVPMRGKTNESAYLIHTARRLAEIKDISEDMLATHVKQNFFSLFKKAKDTYIDRTA